MRVDLARLLHLVRLRDLEMLIARENSDRHRIRMAMRTLMFCMTSNY